MNNKRYEILDGMRGIAALLVLTRHTTEFWTFTLHHSYLAVDLFFLLSGFVLASSYDISLRDRVLSVRRFIFLRLIRLYPLFLLSVFVCFLVFIFGIYRDQASHSLLDIAGVVVLTSLFIPSRFAGDDSLFSLNAPYWSLFYELIVNFIYAFSVKFLTDRILMIFVVFFGLVILGGCLIHGDMDVGSRWKVGSVLAGFSRAIFGFGLGVFLFRKIRVFNYIFVSKRPVCFSGILILFMIAPDIPGFNAMFDLFAVFLVFPFGLMMILGEPAKFMRRILFLLGAVSYPIYVLHVPLGALFYSGWPDLIRGWAPFGGLLFVAILFFVSVMVEKIFDAPLRRYFIRRFF